MGFLGVLFDLDGTLLDTLEDIADATNCALEALGYPQYPLADYRAFIGDGVETLIRRTIPSDRQTPEALQRCAARMKDEYAQRWANKSRPYPGVAEMLDELAAHHIPMAVLSNKPDEFTRLCVARLLPQWSFAMVQGASPALPRKPDPAGALAVAAQLHLDPPQMLYLGDMNTDMQTAVAAGMYPVGALWGFRTAEELLTNGARVLVEQPQDVLKLLECPRGSREE